MRNSQSTQTLRLHLLVLFPAVAVRTPALCFMEGLFCCTAALRSQALTVGMGWSHMTTGCWVSILSLSTRSCVGFFWAHFLQVEGKYMSWYNRNFTGAGGSLICPSHTALTKATPPTSVCCRQGNPTWPTSPAGHV